MMTPCLGYPIIKRGRFLENVVTPDLGAVLGDYIAGQGDETNTERL
jgi:hypothetical protein